MTLGLSCGTSSFVLKAPLLLSSAWDLSSEEEFPLSGTLNLKLGECLQRLGVVFTIFIFLVIHFLVLGTVFGYGGSCSYFLTLLVSDPESSMAITRL